VIAQKARSRAAVQVLLDSYGAESLQVLLFAARQFPRLLPRESQDTRAFGGDAIENGVRKGIGKAKRYEVSGVIFFPVRQPAALADGDIAEAGAGRPRNCRRGRQRYKLACICRSTLYQP